MTAKPIIILVLIRRLVKKPSNPDEVLAVDDGLLTVLFLIWE